MPAPSAAPAANAQGLSPEQLRQIADARRRSAKIRKGVSVALFDGWTIGIFAGLTLIGGLFSFVGLLLGAGMMAVAYVEIRGAKRLRQLDPAAPKTLAWNQVFLGALLFAYAVFSLWRIYAGQTELAAQLNAYPELAGIAGDVERLSQLIGLLIYGTLIAVAVFGQGGTALFYLTRRKYIDAYLRDTPQWIIDAQRAGMPM
jgi:hypothetical protein